MKRFITFMSFLVLCGIVPAAFASTGAIWSTDDTCGGVNFNLFQFKDDVYLNGGPQGGGGGAGGVGILVAAFALIGQRGKIIILKNILSPELLSRKLTLFSYR